MICIEERVRELSDQRNMAIAGLKTVKQIIKQVDIALDQTTKGKPEVVLMMGAPSRFDPKRRIISWLHRTVYQTRRATFMLFNIDKRMPEPAALIGTYDPQVLRVLRQSLVLQQEMHQQKFDEAVKGINKIIEQSFANALDHVE